MSGTTTNESLIYPLTTDFADVQDLYTLAIGTDAKVRGYDAIFTALPRPLAFVYRSSADGFSFTNGDVSIPIDTAEWDTTGGLNGSGWSQPLYDPPSWWMIGANLIAKVISGTPAVTTHIEVGLSVFNTDPVTGLSTTQTYRCKRSESNSGGEQITMSAVVKLWHAQVNADMVKVGDSSVQAPAAGCRLWGFRLGTAT